MSAEKQIKEQFSVISYTKIDNKNTYCHWSEGLTMIINKNGTTIELTGEEMRQIVAVLPKTIGGSY